MKKQDTTGLAVFAALVAFGVIGRWLQPDWNFAPTAAVAGFAAYWFASALPALLVPIAVMALSNLILDGYQGPILGLVVYAAYLAPVGIGRLLHARFTWARFATLCLISPFSFYLATNFAHWALLHQYAHTWAGLVECYVRAWPFFRDGTLAGDVFYMAVLFGGHALATKMVARRAAQAPATMRIPSSVFTALARRPSPR